MHCAMGAAITCIPASRREALRRASLQFMLIRRGPMPKAFGVEKTPAFIPSPGQGARPYFGVRGPETKLIFVAGHHTKLYGLPRDSAVKPYGPSMIAPFRTFLRPSEPRKVCPAIPSFPLSPGGLSLSIFEAHREAPNFTSEGASA